MQVIHRSLDGAPLPDIKACEHLAGTDPDLLVLSESSVQCANCGGYLCADCEDDAVICHSCPGAICKECQETARKRDKPCTSVTGKHSVNLATDRCVMCSKNAFNRAVGGDYLCNLCRDKQDAAKRTFLAETVSRDWDHGMWLDELLDKSESAIAKAKEAPCNPTSRRALSESEKIKRLK
jgi:hypothetical protein